MRSLLIHKERDEQTALHYAAAKGQVAIVSRLLKLGAPTDAKDQMDRTPIHLAAELVSPLIS